MFHAIYGATMYLLQPSKAAYAGKRHPATAITIGLNMNIDSVFWC